MYDDPRLEVKRQSIIAACAHRGIRIEQRGACYRLRGPGVDLKAVDLANLTLADIEPYCPRREQMDARG
jgi:hypothetical protein